MLNVSSLNGMPNASPSTIYCLRKDIPFLPTNYKGFRIEDTQIDYNNNAQEIQVDSNYLINTIAVNNLDEVVKFANVTNVETFAVDSNGVEIGHRDYSNKYPDNYSFKYYGKLDGNGAYQDISLRKSISARLEIQGVSETDKAMFVDDGLKVAKVSKFILTISFYDENYNKVKDMKVTFNINQVDKVKREKNDYFVANGSTAICMLDGNNGIEVYMFDMEYDTWKKIG